MPRGRMSTIESRSSRPWPTSISICRRWLPRRSRPGRSAICVPADRAADAACPHGDRAWASPSKCSTKIDRFDRLEARQEALLPVACTSPFAGERGPLATGTTKRPARGSTPRACCRRSRPARKGLRRSCCWIAAATSISYVTPAPNINLRPYVDRQVGINGQRGLHARSAEIAHHGPAHHRTGDAPRRRSPANRPRAP